MDTEIFLGWASHPLSFLSTQVGISERPARSEAPHVHAADTESAGSSSWSRVAAQGLPAKSPAASAAPADGELQDFHPRL